MSATIAHVRQRHACGCGAAVVPLPAFVGPS